MKRLIIKITKKAQLKNIIITISLAASTGTYARISKDTT